MSSGDRADVEGEEEGEGEGEKSREIELEKEDLPLVVRTNWTAVDLRNDLSHSQGMEGRLVMRVSRE